MKRYLLSVVTVVTLSLVFTNAKASGGATTPHAYSKETFVTSIKKFSKEFVSDEANAKANNTSSPKSSAKICACQILHMQSANYNHTNMVILAEKTNNGDLSSDASKAKTALESEKKHLKNFFYDKIKVEQMLVDGTDCQTMFRKLKSGNTELKLYEILDADIRK